MLKLAKLQHQSYMEDTWDKRIPLECSTPKMVSCIGRQIQNEIRRNSISLATGYKRKSSPQSDEKSSQKMKFSSSSNIPNVIRKEKEQDKSEDQLEDNPDERTNQDDSTIQRSDHDPANGMAMETV